MLYMYTFGYVPDGLMDMDRISETCNNIAPEELKTGDIAVMELEDGRKDFAVCIGAYKEFFLFAHCVNTADSSFPGGCARICFMTSQTDSYYRGSGPTDFTTFYQSPVGFWGNPDNTDSTGEILTTQTSNEATTWLALSQYLQHILAKSFILQHTNSKSLSTLRV